MVYTPKGKLEDIVKQGVVIEILDAEEAIKLYEVIGNHKEALIKIILTIYLEYFKLP
ncbi:hypothetical protein ANSO36C_32480 [Nostoc cf. commune SO-36]|uniref:Uncharacterized protein n=1 Tax=Nostoc cf. commune SO-36 TaxID=449208 RepID=A0ABM7Z383_NOSCO|nr:hypothetical protein [Nostoc commune]BDI17446.1 hypothetical protein ANSO36C_32480 [Nostoc cf. commune SO-36]